MIDQNKARETLLARRKELLADIEHLKEQILETTPGDTEEPEEAAQDRQGDEVLNALGEQDQLEIRQIDAALLRVDEGEYGYCVTCGEEIEAARLDLLPATPFCARHAS